MSENENAVNYNEPVAWMYIERISDESWVKKVSLKHPQNRLDEIPNVKPLYLHPETPVHSDWDEVIVDEVETSDAIRAMEILQGVLEHRASLGLESDLALRAALIRLADKIGDKYDG